MSCFYAAERHANLAGYMAYGFAINYAAERHANLALLSLVVNTLSLKKQNNKIVLWALPIKPHLLYLPFLNGHTPMMDQVKFRYMLEQPVRNSSPYLIYKSQIVHFFLWPIIKVMLKVNYNLLIYAAERHANLALLSLVGSANKQMFLKNNIWLFLRELLQFILFKVKNKIGIWENLYAAERHANLALLSLGARVNQQVTSYVFKSGGLCPPLGYPLKRVRTKPAPILCRRAACKLSSAKFKRGSQVCLLKGPLFPPQLCWGVGCMGRAHTTTLFKKSGLCPKERYANPLQGGFPRRILFKKSILFLSKKEGTSETTRETFSSHFNYFDYIKIAYNPLIEPTHTNPTFILSSPFKTGSDHQAIIDLIWFIGFFEGDGSFCIRPTQNNSIRVGIEITQSIKNVQVIYSIKKQLGFGRVTLFKKNGQDYARWYTSQKNHVLSIVALFNGNLILEKRQIQFENMILQINQKWGQTIQIKPWLFKVNLENSWLSGFTDADGRFFTNHNTDFRKNKLNLAELSLHAALRHRPNGGYYYSFLTKYYITQDGEIKFLNNLQILLRNTTKISQISSSTKSNKKYNRLEICNPESTEILIDYFTRFPLKGIRKLSFLRWTRVHQYKKQNRQLTERTATKLARLIEQLEIPE